MIFTSYTYDDGDRLTGIINAKVTCDQATQIFQLGYGYNAAGELTSYSGPDGSVNYNYDSSGQLTTVSGDQSANYS